ncbi:hypothetical protein [Azospirillum sp. ST 5-10]|uniref:hypothetical protein n=1 Tax=unclassified Azospirillum TaxID=2630922 RepID=UPI003F49E5C0
MPDQDIEARWIIQAPMEILDEARAQAGLDPNAVVAVDDRPRRWEADGRLVYPSFFCPASSGWLKVLASLALGDRPFQIILEEVQPADAPEGDDTVVGITKLFPRMDAEVLGLLRTISAADADRIADLSDRIALAFERLRAGSVVSGI